MLGFSFLNAFDSCAELSACPGEKWTVTYLQHVGLVPRIVVDFSARQQVQRAEEQGGVERVVQLEKLLALSELVEVFSFLLHQYDRLSDCPEKILEFGLLCCQFNMHTLYRASQVSGMFGIA